jgi:hypothetical protein
MTRKELVEKRKENAKFMQDSAQAIERGTIGVQTVIALGIVTVAEADLLKKAEDMGLKAANITRRIANRMEQVQ